MGHALLVIPNEALEPAGNAVTIILILASHFNETQEAVW